MAGDQLNPKYYKFTFTDGPVYIRFDQIAGFYRVQICGSDPAVFGTELRLASGHTVQVFEQVEYVYALTRYPERVWQPGPRN